MAHMGPAEPTLAEKRATPPWRRSTSSRATSPSRSTTRRNEQRQRKRSETTVSRTELALLRDKVDSLVGIVEQLAATLAPVAASFAQASAAMPAPISVAWLAPCPPLPRDHAVAEGDGHAGRAHALLAPEPLPEDPKVQHLTLYGKNRERSLAHGVSDPSTHAPDEHDEVASIASTEPYIASDDEAPERYAEDNTLRAEDKDFNAEHNTPCDEDGTFIAGGDTFSAEHCELNINGLDENGARLTGRLPYFVRPYRKYVEDLPHDVGGAVSVKFLVQNAAVVGTDEVSQVIDIRLTSSLSLRHVADALSCDLRTKNFQLRPAHSPDDIGEPVREDQQLCDAFGKDEDMIFLVELGADTNYYGMD